ncbi:MAG: exo-alpha-sialidase [Bacteroidales bacterium]|nr:exo-alpha-sialidase [Bacteroidales bacterium]
MKKTLTFLFLITLLAGCNLEKQKIKEINFIPQDSSFYINRTVNGHLGFPDIIKLKDKRFLVIYREGKKHADPNGRIMKQYGSKDGKKWSRMEIFYDNPLLDDRDMSLTLMKNGDIAFNYFGSIAAGDKALPTRIFTYFGYSKDNGKSVDGSSLIQIDNNNINKEKYKENPSGYWTDDEGKQLSYQGVSSPVTLKNDKLIIAAYGDIPLVKTEKNNNKKASRIVLFTSEDKGKTWKKKQINPDKLPNVNLQEPFLLNIDNKKMIMHIRTQAEKKYSVKDKMMQAVSDDGGESWSDWQAFDFVGHAPYLIKLKNGVIISAYRDFDPETFLEGAAFIYSLDTGKTWSKPIVFDTPRKDNDSSYPSIQELDNYKFLIVYYTDNGKAIKGKIYKYNCKY